MTWFWPATSLFGFLMMACVVAALGRSSTMRYEFERNAVPARQDAGRPAAEQVPAVAGRANEARSSIGAAQPAPAPRRSAAGSPAHPAGRRRENAPQPASWWLVDDAGGQTVGGPYADRVDAEWAAVSGEPAAPVRVAYGVHREGGVVSRRQSPQFRAWLAELDAQLDRLADDWRDLPSDEDAVATLVVEVAAGLVEAGLSLHDCAGEATTGGVCLTPNQGGVLVSWHQHERMSVHRVHGEERERAVQLTMNIALGDLLTAMGFEVELLGPAGCPRVAVPVG